MSQASKKSSFLNEALAFSGWQMHMQQFEGYDTVGQDVMMCSVDHPNASCCNFFDDTIVANLLPYQIVLFHVLSRPFHSRSNTLSNTT